MIARRESPCLSAEEEIDTVERQICFIPDVDSLNPVYGRFRGVTEDAPDEIYELEVTLEPHQYTPIRLQPNIANLDNRGCTAVFSGSIVQSYRELFSVTGGASYATDCTMPAGADYHRSVFRDVHVRAYPNVDSIVIDYQLLAETPTGPLVEVGTKRFKGIRVN